MRLFSRVQDSVVQVTPKNQTRRIISRKTSFLFFGNCRMNNYTIESNRGQWMPGIFLSSCANWRLAGIGAEMVQGDKNKEYNGAGSWKPEKVYAVMGTIKITRRRRCKYPLCIRQHARISVIAVAVFNFIQFIVIMFVFVISCVVVALSSLLLLYYCGNWFCFSYNFCCYSRNLIIYLGVINQVIENVGLKIPYFQLLKNGSWRE